VAASGPAGVAALISGLIARIVGDPLPVRLEFWDGSALGPAGSPTVVRVRSGDALRRMVWSPNELGLARAYVTGEIEVEG
jgi:cyclopropane-fatty-acyl-phospholipid synthase